MLEDERQALWTVLMASLRFQFEYWLGLCYPSDVLPAARRMDKVLQGPGNEGGGRSTHSPGEWWMREWR